ncbi:H-type small acid-soluble spore protein [Clostridium sp. D2Q-11]|uniref:H-type small acid-soluble spore protein n=1 Tax=Anaeromonas frigoriresistens TaxID=2683708 RepID=A0A942UZR9_9FIRM|nr:H-type small acid-soluble spore protein [Anaeromonas frigoriresistens]MBS4540026.1 H-type small acid-soluble spore protein [Anaeromonas frigoriresistens]
MDKKRAKEIIHSPQDVEVLYNNFPVWLQKVMDKEDLVQVEDMINNKIMQVPSKDLKESDFKLEM